MMKHKDIMLIAGVAVITGIISIILSGIFFNPPKKDSKVPAAESLPTSLPDIQNDPTYSSFLNEQALNPAQPVQIGPTGNTVPFNSNQ